MMNDARKYARARMDALGYKEWTDGFMWDNIPKTIIGKAYVIKTGDPRSKAVSNDNTEIEVPISIEVFKAPGRDVPNLIDAGIRLGDTIAAAFVNARHRLGYAGLLNVLFAGQSVEPLAESNANGVIVTVSFIMLVALSTR